MPMEGRHFMDGYAWFHKFYGCCCYYFRENIDLLTAATVPELTVDDGSLYIYFSKLWFTIPETPDTEGKDRKGALHSVAWQHFWYTQVYSCKFYNEMFELLIPRSNFGSNTVAISEWGEEGTATELKRKGETSNNLKTGGKKITIGNDANLRA